MAYQQQQQQQQQQQVQQYHPQNQDQGNPFFDYQPAFFVKETNLNIPSGSHPRTVRNYYKLLGLDYGQQADEHVIREKIAVLEDQIYNTARDNLIFLREARMELQDPVRRQRHYQMATQVGTYDVMLHDLPRIKDFHDSNSRDAYHEYNCNREKGLHYYAQERSRYVQTIEEKDERAFQLVLQLDSSNTAWRERERALCAEKEAAAQALRDEKARADNAKKSADRIAKNDLDALKLRKQQAVAAARWAIEKVKEASDAHYCAELVEAEAQEAMIMAKAQNDPLFPVRDAEYLAAVAARKTVASSQAVLEQILNGILFTANDFGFGLGIDGQGVKNAINFAAAARKKMREEKLEEARVNREAEEAARKKMREEKLEEARVNREAEEAARVAREQQDARKKSAQRERRERRKQKPADTRRASPVNQTNKVTKSKSKSRPLSRDARKLAEALLEALADKRSSRGAVKEEEKEEEEEEKEEEEEEKEEEEEEEEEGSSGNSSGGGKSPVPIKAESP